MYSKRKYEGNESREAGNLKRPQYSSLYSSAPISHLYGAQPPPFGYTAGPPPFPVVKLRGLPFDCSENDVIDFFHGLDLLDILFVHKNGRFTGEAFCVLAYPLQVDFAIQRNRQNIGRRYIEVFRCKREDYYSAIAYEISSSSNRPHSPRRTKTLNPPKNPNSSHSPNPNLTHTGVLRMRGLPFSATKEDIVEFFKEFEIGENRIYLVVNFEGRASGEAFVEFKSAEDSKEAMKKDRMSLGSRYIELFPSSFKEMDEVLNKERR